MPPQAGLFQLPHSSHQRARVDDELAMSMKRRRLSERDMLAQREDLTRYYAESLARLRDQAALLSQSPDQSSLFALRMYPLSIERQALVQQLESEEAYELYMVQGAYAEEVEKVDEECRVGRERVKERMLEGIEERRRRARDEKDGEGVIDSSLEPARANVTRKLRNKVNTGSPPPLTPPGSAPGPPDPMHVNSNPHSLSIDELPSPFPLSLTYLANGGSNGGNNGATGKRKGKGGNQTNGIYGRAIPQLVGGKEHEIESDLGEIRNKTRKRRVAAQGNIK